jgi:hypothetical protein
MAAMLKTLARTAAFALPFAAAVLACSAPEDGPSPGTYTVKFPSTAAAVATDTVQLFVYAVPEAPAERTSFCQTLIQARRRNEPREALTTNPPVNICELLQGKKPVTIAYGEKAILAVAQRRGADFMIGCTVQTLGDGNALTPIDLALIDVGNPVPETTCNSVGDFCALPPKCTSQ